MSHHPERVSEDPEANSIVPPQDGFHKVIMGEIADPLVAPHPEPPEAEEDELTRAALEDGGKPFPDMPEDRVSPWRPIFLITLAAAALFYIFWRR